MISFTYPTDIFALVRYNSQNDSYRYVCVWRFIIFITFYLNNILNTIILYIHYHSKVSKVSKIEKNILVLLFGKIEVTE